MKRRVILLVSFTFAALLMSCSAHNNSDASSQRSAELPGGESSAGALEVGAAVNDEIEMSMPRDMFGLEVKVPDGWSTKVQGNSFVCTPENVEGVEIRLWCENDRGATREESLERVRASNDQRKEAYKNEEGCELLNSEVESVVVNGMEAQVATYDLANLPEGVKVRRSMIGFGLPQRSVYIELECSLGLYEEYVGYFEKTYQNTRSPEIEGREVRSFVDNLEDLHVDMPEYSFDLPEYWLGRVDVVKRDDGGMSVYPAGDYTCSIMAARISPDDWVTDGDYGSGSFCKEAMGNGRTVILSVTRYPCLVVNALDYRSPGEEDSVLRGMSDDTVKEAIDLETGGKMSFDEILANPEAFSGECFDNVQDYMIDTVAPSLVTHPDGWRD